MKQAGSFVSWDRLRFDFTHFSSITTDQIKAIEKEVNARIRENSSVNTVEMNMDDAVKSGATALFEEKYGDVVRVVSMGKFSRELCGGTHTARTGDIGFFHIVSEAGIASGVRRIEALTGEKAVEYVDLNLDYLRHASELLKTSPKALVEKIENLVAEKKAGDKEILRLKSKIASKSIDSIETSVKEINGVKFLSRKVQIDNPSQLRDLADKFKSKIGSGVVLLGALSKDKVLLISVVTDDLTKKFNAGKIVKKAAAIVGGGGGGRPDMAQAGGSQPENLDKALESLYEI